jgi:hypothetical protein
MYLCVRLCPVKLCRIPESRVMLLDVSCLNFVKLVFVGQLYRQIIYFSNDMLSRQSVTLPVLSIFVRGRPRSKGAGE